jgi:hypothetical protein
MENYIDLQKYFATRPDKLFVAITAPPMMQGESMEPPDNAWAFNNWLVNDWLDDYPYQNVAVFVLYNALTSNGGDANTNDLGQERGNHYRWWNSAVQHIQTVADDLPVYPIGDSQPSPAGTQKATDNFLPLLNVFYNAWRGEPGVVAPQGETGSAQSELPESVVTQAPENPILLSGETPEVVDPDLGMVPVPVEAVILSSDLLLILNLWAAGHFEVFNGEEKDWRSTLCADLSTLPSPINIESSRLETIDG